MSSPTSSLTHRVDVAGSSPNDPFPPRDRELCLAARRWHFR